MDNLELAEHSAEPLWRVRAALSGLQGALATDHYALDVVDLEGDELTISIRALEGACEECLISHDMITSLIRTQVPSDLGNLAVQVSLDVPEGWICEV